MGYCIDYAWDIRVPKGKLEALREALVTGDPWGKHNESDVLEDLLIMGSEDGALAVDGEGDTARVQGWTGGKFYDDSWNVIVEALVKAGAVGTIDGHTEDDFYFRLRFFGRGFREYAGEVVYPNDPGVVDYRINPGL